MSRIIVIKHYPYLKTGILLKFLFTIDHQWYSAIFQRLLEDEEILKYYSKRNVYSFNCVLNKTPIILGVIQELEELQQGKLYNKLDPMEWHLHQCLLTLLYN